MLESNFLSDPLTKKALSRFLNEKLLAAQETKAIFGGRLQMSERSVNNYLNGDGKFMPGKIPEQSYYDFLEAARASHEEFVNYLDTFKQEFAGDEKPRTNNDTKEGESSSSAQDNSRCAQQVNIAGDVNIGKQQRIDARNSQNITINLE